MVRYLDDNSGFQQFAASRDSAKKSNLGPIIAWIAIFAAAWLLFSMWLSPGSKNEKNAAENGASLAEEVIKVPEKTVENEKLAVNIQGLRVRAIALKDYNADENSNEKITLLSNAGEFAEAGLLANGTTAPNAGTVWNASQSPRSNSLIWRNADGIEFSRNIDLDGYVVKIRDVVKNNSGRDVSFVPYARIVRSAGESTAGVATGGIAHAGEKIRRENWKSVGKESFLYSTPSGFAGFEDQYWETIAQIDSSDQTIKLKPVASGKLQAEISAAPMQVAAGATAAIETKIFAGPKEPAVLKAAALEIAGIDQTIDYGWFWFLARPFLWTLNALQSLVANWGLAIILLTIAIRILMWPLTKKSFQGMSAMQKMQPEMQRIQKTYGNDKARMQIEMMALYKNSKTSPVSGCLPMLLQIPIFFALYKALLIAVPLRQAQFLWISDLAVMDPYFILPILMGITMWWQQRLQTAASKTDGSDPMSQTQKMMKWMPLLFTALFAFMPAGLVLYWTVSNLFGIGQMRLMKGK